MNEAATLSSQQLKDSNDMVKKLQHQFQEKGKALINAEEEISALTKKLQEVGEQSSDIVNQWKGKHFYDCISSR